MLSENIPWLKKTVHIRKEMFLGENIHPEFTQTQEQPAVITLTTVGATYSQIALYTPP